MNTFSFLFTLLLSASAISAGHLIRRQDLSALPPCGQKCLIHAASSKKLVGKCSLSDEKCFCKNEPFQASVRSCVENTCSDSDKLKVISFDDKTCPGQHISSLPACGQLCLLKSAANKQIIGKCSATDNACLCSNDAFQKSVQKCVLGSCNSSEIFGVLSWAKKTCPSHEGN
ncbi:hypothetical protein CROQUDRAFT_656371 [Cronartium quercuum f. sp. fusiforme G11]|uniref:CFEM domain-containing protein n=1 Tax=Cronartium quercuum f. sp. fusiforme G11 TaxID=708437 RepID=A0A9P6TCE0_9BASI|nr:hypothetical protein CROQUDRAFT_656371 [Cronartium quercuum f. sp. fusiforme G11]